MYDACGGGPRAGRNILKACIVAGEQTNTAKDGKVTRMGVIFCRQLRRKISLPASAQMPRPRPCERLQSKGAKESETVSLTARRGTPFPGSSGSRRVSNHLQANAYLKRDATPGRHFVNYLSNWVDCVEEKDCCIPITLTFLAYSAL